MAEALFPVFLKLFGRAVLVVGGGPVAAAKARALVSVGAKVRVVAPSVAEQLRAIEVEIVERPFAPADLEGAWLVIAAATPEVNRAVVAEAERRRLFVNAVDDAQAATAYLGAVVRRGGVTLALSTDGQAPALAGLLREGLEALLPNDLPAWLQTAQALRPGWKAEALPHRARRPKLLEALNGLYPPGERERS